MNVPCDDATLDVTCRKALYGLKQALRFWYMRQDELAGMIFKPSAVDVGLQVADREAGQVYILVYVDSIPVAAQFHDDQMMSCRRLSCGSRSTSHPGLMLTT